MALNLARAWRSKTFDQLVGQALSVRMLKNSLYLGHLFPLYLLSGQRGCGKTSLARILAAALNCSALVSFQQNPKNQQFPCLTCDSCSAMSSSSHPDFIEVDGASQTGVDNVRTIIETATFLPVLGTKKIYLIDEAHMLSKAAFNAFLKMLEEPPAHVHFILATTQASKIIDTVRSRSFQLFFKPIEPTAIAQHLEHICKQEKISYETAGLLAIANATEGSLRDALNLLEQARFCAPKVTKKAIYDLLGYPDESFMHTIFTTLIHKDYSTLATLITSAHCTSFQPQALWFMMAKSLNMLLALKTQGKNDELWNAVASTISWAQLSKALKIVYDYEQKFSKSINAQGLLEVMFLELYELLHTTTHDDNSLKNKNVLTSQEVSKTSKISTHVAPNSEVQQKQVKNLPEPVVIVSHDAASLAVQADSVVVTPSAIAVAYQQEWNNFVQAIEALNDPLLISIFKQPLAYSVDLQSLSITVNFASHMSFFNEVLESTKSTWNPVLNKIFGYQLSLTALFVTEVAQMPKRAEVPHVMPQVTRPVAEKQASSTSIAQKPRYAAYKKAEAPKVIKQYKLLDVSDVALWPQANALLTLLSGSIRLADESFKKDYS